MNLSPFGARFLSSYSISLIGRTLGDLVVFLLTFLQFSLASSSSVRCRMSSSQIPHPHAHTLKHPHQVHFYSDDAPLIHELCHVLVKALKEGQSVVVIATLDHRERISECLGQAPEFSKARAEGRYVALDAAELLSRFMMAGMPDADRFSKIVGNVMVRAASAARKGAPKVVAFGEMVAILCAEGKKDAALRLEELWNQLANQHAFSLYCAYP